MKNIVFYMQSYSRVQKHIMFLPAPTTYVL